MECKGCNKEKEIANKHWKLCAICNRERLDEGKEPRAYKYVRKDIKAVKTTETRLKRDIDKGSSRHKLVYGGGGKPKGLSNLILDEVFYEKCFNNSNHECEECGTSLPIEFRDGAGKLIARFRYSHIVAKSIAPELRHSLKNINHLCLRCHTKWDFGDKKSMDIYRANSILLPDYF